MPWVNDRFYYTRGILEAIADWYDRKNDYGATSSIYEVLVIGDYQIVNAWGLVDFKADFDMALDYIGHGEWQGLTSLVFRDYKYFGKQQRIVIADILGILDDELSGWGFYEIPQLRGQAYGRMVAFLNENHSYGLMFKANKGVKSCHI